MKKMFLPVGFEVTSLSIELLDQRLPQRVMWSQSSTKESQTAKEAGNQSFDMKKSIVNEMSANEQTWKHRFAEIRCVDNPFT